MNNLKNKEMEDTIEKIINSESYTIPNDLFRNLIDNLAISQLLCPVKDDEIVFFDMGLKKFIPAFTDLDKFEKVFKEESPEIFKFKYFKEFLTDDLEGILINPQDYNYPLTNGVCQLVFNKTRTEIPVSKGYDVKVRLNDFRPLTWRDLIIPENMTFMELDDVLKTLWDFNGHHLSCFLIRKDRLCIMDKELSDECMMSCDYDANTTTVSEIFDKYNKVTYWYDFGDDWQFDIEIKKKVDYTKDYVTIKRFKGKYNPVEDCRGVYGLSEIVYYAENPDERDSSYYSDLVDYLEEFDMEYAQLLLECKGYTKSLWKV